MAKKLAAAKRPRSSRANAPVRPTPEPEKAPLQDARPNLAPPPDVHAAPEVPRPDVDARHLHRAIAARAFELFVERRGAHGSRVDDWLRAEAELRALGQEPPATRSA